MSRLNAWAGSGPEEPLILAAPRHDAVIAAVLAALTAAVFAVAAIHGALGHIQRIDDAWLRLMISGRSPQLTAVAKVFNVLGLVYVTLPVRLALIGYLAFRRRWWHLAAFAAAVLLSEILIGPVKGVYDRPRPPGSLVATSASSARPGSADSRSAGIAVAPAPAYVA